MDVLGEFFGKNFKIKNKSSITTQKWTMKADITFSCEVYQSNSTIDVHLHISNMCVSMD